MQCGCPECGALMPKVEKGLESICKCPDCGVTCSACMGNQRGANVLFKKDMTKEEWELALKLRELERK